MSLVLSLRFSNHPSSQTFEWHLPHSQSLLILLLAPRRTLPRVLQPSDMLRLGSSWTPMHAGAPSHSNTSSCVQWYLFSHIRFVRERRDTREFGFLAAHTRLRGFVAASRDIRCGACCSESRTRCKTRSRAGELRSPRISASAP